MTLQHHCLGDVIRPVGQTKILIEIEQFVIHSGVRDELFFKSISLGKNCRRSKKRRIKIAGHPIRTKKKLQVMGRIIWLTEVGNRMDKTEKLNGIMDRVHFGMIRSQCGRGENEFTRISEQSLRIQNARVRIVESITCTIRSKLSN